MDQEKRQLREQKRQLKKRGNKRRRQHFKKELEEDPEQAHRSEYDFGRFSSAPLNDTIDQDRTRRRDGAED